MDIADIIKTTISVIIAAIGWMIVHYFNSKRDRTLKRREIITKHLIDAYKFLADEIVHRESTFERDKKLELVIAELQLFGSHRQIELAKELTDAITKGGTFYVDELLNELRNDLRHELGLPPVTGNVRWLRFKESNN